MGEKAQEKFNAKVNEHFEGTRDYIVTHFKTNTRKDTDYWRANADNTNVSEAPAGASTPPGCRAGNIAPAVGSQKLGKGYPIFSWFSIFAGMGIFPEKARLRPAGSEDRYKMTEIDNLLTRSLMNFRGQRQVLGSIPKKVKEESLQIYFW